jgi:elongation factor Ts
VEISTQTDFAANSEEVRAVAGTLAANLLLDIDGSRNDLLLADLRAKTGESVHLRTFVLSKIFDDPSVRISSYVHHDRKTASVVVFSHAESLKEEVMKQIAMHVAGAQPEPLVVSPENLLDSQISKEREFREKAAAESGKPADIQKKMVEGALNKYKASLALTKQQFILDPTKTVEQVLGEKAKIVDFLKIKVGIAT